jgi:hypothetical protein
LVTVLAGEVVPRVRGEEEGDLLEWCECGADEGVVSKEVGAWEGRDDGGAHVEFVTQGVEGAVVVAEAELVGEVPAGGRGEELVGG